jgi:hypothetical protein
VEETRRPRAFLKIRPTSKKPRPICLTQRDLLRIGILQRFSTIKVTSLSLQCQEIFQGYGQRICTLIAPHLQLKCYLNYWIGT